MANRYWVGGSGSWSEASTHWSNASNGSPSSAYLPTSADSVIFDAYSGTGTLTVTANSVCYSFSSSSSSLTSITGSGLLSCYGSSVDLRGFSSTYSWTGNLGLDYSGVTVLRMPTGKTTSNNVIRYGGGRLSLATALSLSTKALTIYEGEIDTNSYSVTCGTLSWTSSASATWTLDGSTITLSGGVDFSGSGSISLDAGTSSLIINNGYLNCPNLSLTWYDVTLNNPTSQQTVQGNNTFNNLTISGTTNNTGGYSFDSDQTVSNVLSSDGNSAINRLWLTSAVLGSQITLSVNSISSLTNTDFTDIEGAGSASWSGTSIGNANGNTGITFTTPVTRYWVGDAGNWNSTGEWSSSSGGSTGASVPLCHDTAIFDAASFSATRTVTANMRLVCGIIADDIDYAFSLGLGQSNTYFFGSISNNSALKMTISANSYYLHYYGSDSNSTIKMPNGINIGYFQIECPWSSVSLLSDFTLSGGGYNRFFLENGTFDANDFNVTVEKFVSNNANSRTLYMGNGTWTINGSGTTTSSPWYLSIGINLYCESSTLILNLAAASYFYGAGQTYNIVQYYVPYVLTIYDSNTFNSFIADTTAGAASVKFYLGTTQNFTNIQITGYSGKILTFCSTSSVRTSLVCPSGVIVAEYCDIDYLDVSGGASWWYATTSTCNSSDGWNQAGLWIPKILRIRG